MKKVPIKIENEYVDGAGVVCGAKNSSRTTTLRVEFVNWDGLSKYATFKNSKGQNSTLVVLTLDMEVEPNIYEITIPTDAMTEEGMMMVTFTGYTVEEGDPATLGALENTATAYFRVLPSDAEFDDGSINASAQMQLQAEIDMLKTNYQALPDRVAEAAQYANNSQTSAINSATSAENAATSEANALAYKNRAEAVRNSINGGYVTCGSVYFADLPSLEDCGVGYMFSIKDDFTTTSDFEEGAGVEHVAGTAVFKTNNDKWDTQVSDVATLQDEVEELQGDVATNTSAISTLNTDVAGKVDKVTGKGLSTEDYTSEEKTKLAGIATGATAITVDSALSSSSTNPVQNKIVNAALGGKSNTLAVFFVERAECIFMANHSWVQEDFTADATKAGYTPLAIVGVEADGGENCYAFISATRIENNTAYITVTSYTHTGSANKCGYKNLYVLYVKN